MDERARKPRRKVKRDRNFGLELAGVVALIIVVVFLVAWLAHLA